MSNDNIDRNYDWIQTYSGHRFYPLAPDYQDIEIIDIAAALSKLCRYGGHCLRFYSVAEHCVLMARKAPAHLRLAMLLHDASEGLGLVDIPRPVKHAMPEYLAIERRLTAAVAHRFGLPNPLPPEVHQYDERIIVDERAQNMRDTDHYWHHAPPRVQPLGVRLQFWTPQQAKIEFLSDCAAAIAGELIYEAAA
jgi:hypothetical protein